MKRTGILLIVLMAMSSLFAHKAKVLILTGANNHNWSATTPVLKNILEASDRFDVDVVTEPEELTKYRLSGYDVLLSNWNAFGKEKPAPWSKSLQDAYVEFVRNGGGHVVVHAGSSSFYDWDDYHTISNATWKGKTGHKEIHEFEVRMTDAEHPVTQGLDTFKTTDELWFRPFVQPGAEVLAESFSKTTGDWEPTALVSEFGKGRCFTLLLGHDANSMQSDVFKNLLIRGTEWASGGKEEIQETADSISMIWDGSPLWTFNHSAEEGKPYFHPLATTKGTVFSDLRPDDHPWHRALWFSWKFINGVNYWEENRETGKSEGQTMLLDIDRTVLPDKAVQVKMELAYAPAATGERVLEESRTVLISPPDASGAYRIDWSSEFRALDHDVILDRTPLPEEPDGKTWGGYAGYSMRMNSGVFGGTYLNSEGLAGADTNHQPARWASYTAPNDGSILFLDHPENLNHPAKWYVAPGMGYFSPAVIHDARHTIKAGETLELHYRLIINPGAVDTAYAEAEWSEWIKTD
ncbi:DUF6807 family protein [Rubellicoccus peritrichatus]|uniref:DUF6807 family protein n=1 Tax=Rubellicoccus peritrichatus TaxID=3080537 RepID=A0AAQ3QXI8_9BACT|nr:DUF6807 family protein [Puniceicoccus sp. CR14]WOO43728.1 DUF6807 family protein [Puniceicoccus sp. CR14]